MVISEEIGKALAQWCSQFPFGDNRYALKIPEDYQLTTFPIPTYLIIRATPTSEAKARETKASAG